MSFVCAAMSPLLRRARAAARRRENQVTADDHADQNSPTIQTAALRMGSKRNPREGDAFSYHPTRLKPGGAFH
jgi:hypothetical protein